MVNEEHAEEKRRSKRKETRQEAILATRGRTRRR
jgi:hypothetical protein